jgi:hypothetical protein
MDSVRFRIRGLAAYHAVQSTKSAPDLHTASRGRVFIGGVPIDAPLREFSMQFNEYLHGQNESSRNQNLASAAGYVAAIHPFTAWRVTPTNLPRDVGLRPLASMAALRFCAKDMLTG